MMKCALTALVLAAACVDTPPLQEQHVESSRVTIREIPETPRATTDLLIVVDDTVGMAPYQAQLATLPARLASRIDWYTRRWIDLRLAVATNDGTLRRLPGMDTPWLADAFDFDYTRRRNFDGTLADRLAELMAVGTANEGPSQPLEAGRRALETGSELMRDKTGLMVLTISATDDASTWPVSDYVEWMTKLAGGDFWGRGVLLSGLYLQPAARLDEYFKATHAIITPLDGDNFEAAIPWFPAGPNTVTFGCSEAVDLDPTTPAFDYDCAMMASINGTWRTVPECTPNQRDGGEVHDRNIRERGLAGPPESCWAFRPDPQSCFYGDSKSQLVMSGYTAFQHPALRFDCRSN
ncbi:MAG TPA: hypothetical protein VFV99_23085 [Kofleriaceae bacterium]|nr:hypothetical protein [Kofleriaceae bacterium]